MADFLHLEAEESSDEEYLAPRDSKRAKKAKTIDSSDEEYDDDDDLKDLIDDTPIEESDASRGKKRKKSYIDDRLEDDDYDLLEENLGVKVARNKFKRIRGFKDDEREGEEDHNSEQDRDRIALDIFSENADDRSSERSHRAASEPEASDDEEEEEYSDADDFIVDDVGRPGADKKKPIHGNAALQDAQEMFGVGFDYNEFSKYDGDDYSSSGDEDEVDERPKTAAGKKTIKKSIFELYEPSELKRGFFTDLDDEIRNTDIPERMQLRDVPVTSVPKGSTELDEEAAWIYKQAFCKAPVSIADAHLSLEDREKMRKGKIKTALDFIRNQHMEVPFIAFYRKEYVYPELNINDLWTVYKFDAKWCHLKSSKDAMIELFEKMRSYQLDVLTKDPEAPIPDTVRIMKDIDLKALENVQTPEELSDVHSHFLLYYAADLPAMNAAWRIKEKEKNIQAEGDGEPELKYANRSGSYSLCSRAGLGPLASKFGLSPEHFAENLRDNYQRHAVDQECVGPLDVARKFISPKFPTVEEVIQAAKYMVALQIAKEPLVRKCVRRVFYERAKMNVIPTKKGQHIIDESHNCYSMKYVKGKPVRDLTGDQFLKLYLAEKEQLLTITINGTIEGTNSSSYIDEVKQLYIRDEFSKIVQDWNALRTECVEKALTQHILPDLISELKRALLAEAKESVLKACCRKLYDWIKIAPYAVKFSQEDGWETSKGLRVMGLAYVPEYDKSAFACILAPGGEMTSYLRLPHILKRRNSFRQEDIVLKESELRALKNFIYTRKPHVIAIGGESMEALMIAEDLRSVVKELVRSDRFPPIQVEIIDNELAKVFANSKKGRSDFKDYPELLTQAVSIARKMQDPLVEYSQLCNADEDILSLRFHPLQGEITKEELLEAVYLEFVNRTNEVGVDINLAIQQAHRSNLVQFICGLGPRKGRALLRTIKQTNRRLENRTQLVTSCHMGPKLFTNCSGFIKLDTNMLGDSYSYIEILDGSRVHPESYELARKMAVDALEYGDGANPAEALEEILNAPERLKDLDLDAFADEMEGQEYGSKKITLYDVRAELTSRYADFRRPFRSADPENLFDILTKETPATFYIGKLITATVVGIARRKPRQYELDRANPVRNDETGLWQCPFCVRNDIPELSEVWDHFDSGSCQGQAIGLKLRLDNGISGFIYVKNISDTPVSNPCEIVGVGQLIQCRIQKIDVGRFSVECTSKSSDVLDKSQKWGLPRDPYYYAEQEEAINRSGASQKLDKQRNMYMKRVIVHPAFHNITYAEAEKCMADMDQGEVIVRPSSKGPDHLTVTWKVADGIHQHIDVKEEGKVAAYSLGKTLLIGKEAFEDLDEIIARHVTPMASYARDLVSFRYYKEFEGGHRSKVEKFLIEEKKKNASKIHYVISAAKNIPGTFLLSYLPKKKVGHENITVTPEGFRFRQRMFDSIDSVMRWFKEHFRELPTGTPSGRTPYGSGTPAFNINSEAVRRVAQNLPSHIMQTLSTVARQTPNYSYSPGAGAYGPANYLNAPYAPSISPGVGAYGSANYLNAPYTPSSPKFCTF